MPQVESSSNKIDSRKERTYNKNTQRIYKEVTTPCDSTLPPQKGSNIGKKTLVLDLDETLVHCSFQQIKNPDAILPV